MKIVEAGPVSEHRKYWEDRLRADPNLKGTGHRAFDVDYNRILYQAQKDCLELMLAKHEVEIGGKSVLDVGSGTGFYVHLFKEAGARTVTGIDIAETSICYLRETFPDSDFLIGDVGAEEVPVTGPFEIVSAISVLYHLVDDDRFEQAVAHLTRLVSGGGYLLITDRFTRPLLPSASHARFRPLGLYRTLLLERGVHIVDVLPMYYFLNKPFLPVVGPFVLRSKRLQRRLYDIDKRWRTEGRDNGRGMKLMLARKTSPGRQATD